MIKNILSNKEIINYLSKDNIMDFKIHNYKIEFDESFNVISDEDKNTYLRALEKKYDRHDFENMVLRTRAQLQSQSYEGGKCKMHEGVCIGENKILLGILQNDVNYIQFKAIYFEEGKRRYQYYKSMGKLYINLYVNSLT